MLPDAFEITGTPRVDAVLYTCEHASNRVPDPWSPTRMDLRLLKTHWGWDIGCADLTRALARVGDTAGVLSRVTRLICDVNRAPDDPTLAPEHTDDGDPSFNTSVDRAERVARFHVPYHDAIDSIVRSTRPRLLVSLHSFTPSFRGVRRKMEAGVLFDQHDALADQLVHALRDSGLRTEPNAPYSGKDGLIYSAARHGQAHALRYLEIELRQDLLATPDEAAHIALAVHKAIETLPR